MSKNCRSPNVFLVLIIVQICLVTNTQSQPLTILSSNQSGIVLEFSLDSVFIGENFTIKTIPELQKDLFGFPVFQDIIIGTPENVDASWYFNDIRSIMFPVNNLPIVDRSIGLDQEQEVESIESLPPNQPVSTMSGPIIKGHHTTVIKIHPVILSENETQIIKKITIHLAWNQGVGISQPHFLSKFGFSQLNRELRNNRTFATPDIPDYQFSNNLLQITVDTSAWYTFDYGDFIDSTLSVDMDPTTFQLWHDRDQIPIFVKGESDHSFDSGDKIIFHGLPAQAPDNAPYRNNFYTNENVYWLTWGGLSGLRYLEESAYPGLPQDEIHLPETYLGSIFIEKDEYFARLGKMHVHEQWDSFDHFFMNPAIDAGTIKSFEFVAPHPWNSDNSMATLLVNLQGTTLGTHTVQILINDHLVTSGAWLDQNSYDIQSTFSQEYLSDGNNVLTILNQESTEGEADFNQVYLNWFQLQYQKYFKVNNDHIEFARDGAVSAVTQFEIDGFSTPNIFIFKGSESRLRDFTVTWNVQHGGYTAVVQDFIDGQSNRYAGFTEETLRPIKKFKLVDPLPALDDIPESEYIIVLPDSFETILLPLAEYHNATMVNADHVYRYFSGGIVSPYALKEFFRWAYNSWSIQPKYVLLGMWGKWFGWGGVSHSNQRFIPAMRIQTVNWGATSSDFWYTLISCDDYIPEFSIGRFSVSSKDECSVLVDKTLSALNGNSPNWKSNVINIGGYEDTFKEQSESLIAREVSNGFNPIRLYIDKYSEGGPYFGTTDSLINYINRGVSYINFLGHGGGAVWADRSLLTISDIPLIENTGKYPFVTSMTCFSGDVTNPNALGRRLLSKGDGGVMGWFGSAGLGWIINDYLLLEPIHQRLFTSTEKPIGDIITEGKIIYSSTNTSFPSLKITQLFQFNLSGDPAFVPYKPPLLPVDTNINDPEPGETIILGSTSDSLHYQLFDDRFQSYSKYPINVVDNTIHIPDTLGAGSYTLSIKGKHDGFWKIKTQPIYISGSSVQWCRIQPEFPGANESISIDVCASDRDGISSLTLWESGEQIDEFQQTQNDTFQLINPIHFTTPGSIHFLNIKAVDNQQSQTWSTTKEIQVKPVIDVYPADIEYAGNDSTYLNISVDRSAEAFPCEANITVHEMLNDSLLLLLDRKIEFPTVASVAIKIPTIITSGDDHELRVVCTMEDSLSNTSNDTLVKLIVADKFQILPDIGTTENYTTHSDVRLGNVEINVAPGVASKPTVIHAEILDGSSFPTQTGLHIAYDSGIDISGISDTEYILRWQLDSIPNNSHLFIWDATYEFWYPWNSAISDSLLEFYYHSPAMFGLFRITDNSKPTIEVAINGQQFMQNGYVNATPTISVFATDNIGVDPRSEQIQIWIDDQLQQDEIIRQKTLKEGRLSFLFQPTLSESDNEMSLVVHDLAGIASDTLNLSFIVKSKLELIDYGNFPNPFIDQTRFAYELTETVDDFTMEIYTVDGRRICHFDESSALTNLDLRTGAFHELIWNGKTDEGDFVSNGVYFYRMVATKGKTKIERKGKIAKAR